MNMIPDDSLQHFSILPSHSNSQTLYHCSPDCNWFPSHMIKTICYILICDNMVSGDSVLLCVCVNVLCE